MNNQYGDLKNKIVLVTGATKGIGKAISQMLASQGAHVVINDLLSMKNTAEQIKDDLMEMGASQVSTLLFDITSEDQIKEALKSFADNNDPITGLVNNAGISKDQMALRLKEKDLSKVIDTNLKGAIILTSQLGRQFLRAKDVSVINISSVVGLMGNSGQIAYAASKAGLIGFTKSFAKEMSSRNVRCNAICPGFIQTDMTNSLPEEAKEHYLSNIPLKRFGQAEDVANLVCFLLSKSSSYITGEIIKIDGGLYI